MSDSFSASRVTLIDLEPTASDFLSDAIAGLTSSPKRLPSKYFYDSRGSSLFDRICELEEYYPTRTEIAILRSRADEIANAIGEHAAVIEYGSGSGLKTEILLDHVRQPSSYVAIDISMKALSENLENIATRYPQLRAIGICGDYTQPLAIPEAARLEGRRVIYFPGSTIGNFAPTEANAFLRGVWNSIGDSGGAVIGIDLVKDTQVLERAYNDAGGVTAAFNLNLIKRLRDELGAEVDEQDFRHIAFFNPEASRVEMHLEARRRLSFSIGSTQISLSECERILTEYSHKYTTAGFASQVAEASLTVRSVWKDERDWFAVLYLTRA